MKRCDQKGRVHSIETLGALDGPGIRTVVFLQGCPLRCRFCHNPDTWNQDGGDWMTPEEVWEKIARYRVYFRNGGGVTLSGGEPLGQPEFTARLLELCCQAGVHTAIDTGAGVVPAQLDRILDHTGLVILDIKHTDPDQFHWLTGGDFGTLTRMIDRCRERKMPMWVRQVTVPGITDSPDQVARIAKLVEGCRVEKAELLAYHRHGAEKWDRMGIPYPLADTPVPDPETMKTLQGVLCRAMQERKVTS